MRLGREMINNPYRSIAAARWQRDKPGLVLLLGVSPLLAVTTSVTNGLALGLAAWLTLLVSSVCLFLMRAWLRAGTEIVVSVLITASVVSAIELVVNAYFYTLYTSLGIYLPLVAMSCAVMTRSENFADKLNLAQTLFVALTTGASLVVVLVMLGGLRELLGQGLRLAMLPPGAFIGLGLLIAFKNRFDARNRASAQVVTPASRSA